MEGTNGGVDKPSISLSMSNQNPRYNTCNYYYDHR